MHLPSDRPTGRTEVVKGGSELAEDEANEEWPSLNAGPGGVSN